MFSKHPNRKKCRRKKSVVFRAKANIRRQLSSPFVSNASIQPFPGLAKRNSTEFEKIFVKSNGSIHESALQLCEQTSQSLWVVSATLPSLFDSFRNVYTALTTRHVIVNGEKNCTVNVRSSLIYSDSELADARIRRCFVVGLSLDKRFLRNRRGHDGYSFSSFGSPLNVRIIKEKKRTNKFPRGYERALWPSFPNMSRKYRTHSVVIRVIERI